MQAAPDRGEDGLGCDNSMVSDNARPFQHQEFFLAQLQRLFNLRNIVLIFQIRNIKIYDKDLISFRTTEKLPFSSTKWLHDGCLSALLITLETKNFFQPMMSSVSKNT